LCHMKEIELLEKYLSETRMQRIDEVLKQRTRDVCVIIDRLDKAHNYMAIMRTMDAFGIQDAHIVPLESDDNGTISKKVTQGAHKWLTIHMHKSWRECFDAVKKEGYKIYASYLDDNAKGLESLDLSGKVALLFGNELKGLEKEEVKACDGVFILPMVGFSQSYNVSVASALTLQRFFLRREELQLGRGHLSEQETLKLKTLWYKKAVQNSEVILKEELRRIEEK